jgi:hypothetical protein
MMESKLSKRISLEEAIDKVRTNRQGAAFLRKNELWTPIDQAMVRIAEQAVVRYGGSIEESLSAVNRIVQANYSTKEQNLTVSLDEIAVITSISWVPYESFIREIIGFNFSDRDLKEYATGLTSWLRSNINSITIGDDKFILPDDASKTASRLPVNLYLEAVANIITNNVAQNVIDMLSDKTTVHSFSEDFGITSDKIISYFKRGILLAGEEVVVQSVIDSAKQDARYQGVDFSRKGMKYKFREACSAKSDLKSLIDNIISNPNEFVKHLVPVDRIIQELFSSYDLALKMVQDYISSGGEIPFTVTYNGKPHFYHEDTAPPRRQKAESEKEELISKLPLVIPIPIRKKHITQYLNCNDNDLNNVGVKFSCLNSGSSLDPETLKTELRAFENLLYDGAKLAADLDNSNFILSAKTMKKLVLDRFGVERTFLEEKLHKNDVEQIIKDIKRAADKEYECFAQDILQWFEKGYASFQRSGQITVDASSLLGASMGVEEFRSFGRNIYSVGKSRVFFYTGDERLYTDDVIEILKQSTDLSFQGLCARLDFKARKNPFFKRGINYIMAQKGIEFEKGIGGSKEYITKEEADIIESTLQQLQEKGLGIFSSSFVGMANMGFVSYYSETEARALLGMNNFDITPVVTGDICFYSSSDLADYARKHLAEHHDRRHGFDFVTRKLRVCESDYEVLMLAAALSTTIGGKGMSLGSARTDRSHEIKRNLKLSDFQYGYVRDKLGFSLNGTC